MIQPDPIEYGKLSRSINGRPLFDNLRLHIDPGECIVLSGDNGAGKTTLLRILAGLLPPETGECRYNGNGYRWKRARPWLLQNVVYLHQEPYLFDSRVLDNIAYGLRRRGHTIRHARDIATRALNATDLGHLLQRNARQLSGGEKQRVALLRAWVLSPRLLLLDEPVASMDERSRHRTLFLIRRLQQDGVSLIITAHEPRLFAPLAERHLCLKQGQLNPARPLTSQTDVIAESTRMPQEKSDEQWHLS
ncbi:MAG: energy-coupling factor ABC transporter ATP-binding protein [Thiohalophilus sp.]